MVIVRRECMPKAVRGEGNSESLSDGISYLKFQSDATFVGTLGSDCDERVVKGWRDNVAFDDEPTFS